MLLPQDEPKRIVALFAEKIPEGKILDLGCNTGRNSLFLAKTHLVDAVDKDEEALKLLKAKNKTITTHHQNIVDFAFKKKYAGIICTDTLHFLTLSDLTALVEKMKKHTLAGGLNIITVFTKKGELVNPVFKHFFDPDELKQYYKDWEILTYTLKMADCHAKKPDGKPFQHETAMLVARKL